MDAPWSPCRNVAMKQASDLEEPLPRPGAMGRKSAWLIPGGLLCLFIVTAFAGRLIKKETLRASIGGADNLVEDPVQGGVFRYPLLGNDLRTLDPAKAIFSTDVMLVQQLYDGLTAFDEHLNVVPALAKFWEISPE